MEHINQYIEKMDIGKVVKLRRVELDLSQKKLAKKAGCSEPTIVNLERTSTCSLKTFMKVLDALGLKMNFE